MTTEIDVNFILFTALTTTVFTAIISSVITRRAIRYNWFKHMITDALSLHDMTFPEIASYLQSHFPHRFHADNALLEHMLNVLARRSVIFSWHMPTEQGEQRIYALPAPEAKA